MKALSGQSAIVGYSCTPRSGEVPTELLWGNMTFKCTGGVFSLRGHMGIVHQSERVLFKLRGTLESGVLEIYLSEGVWTDQDSCLNLREKFSGDDVPIRCEEDANGSYVGISENIGFVLLAFVPVIPNISRR